jgi:O-antigen biosynthesis protein WbqV
VAALAVPLARAIADPSGDWLHPPWLPAAGAATLLLAGLPFRLPWQFWRFSGMDDLLAVAWSSAVGAVLFAFVLASTGTASGNPAFPVVYALTLLVLLGTPRIVYRRWRYRRDGTLPGSFAPDIPSALVVGATEDIDLFLRALAWDRRHTLQVEGLLAVGARQTGRRIHGCPFLGSIEDTAAVLERLAGEGRLPDTMVVTTPDLAGQSLAVLVEQAEAHGMRIRRAPRPTSLDAAGTSDRARELELRPMAIEDLLNRAQVPLDREGMARLIQGRRVIVTGAGGTIGSELARQVAALGPERLILLDNGEYALWLIDLELAERHPHVPRESLLADIRDEARVRDLFEQWRPELVFHAAALKHVPMVEANPLEGLLTNVAGTRHVADAARSVGARAMVLISTDKAVNPTSVMGASKRLAEMYCQALDDEFARRSSPGQHAMRLISVRFGNVLASNGSVVPKFKAQIEAGGPVTVTHPDMVRYFMTIREACDLVITSASHALENRNGDVSVYVLNMGQPVKIVDLAERIIRLSGLEPGRDIKITFTGIRPGERLHEILFAREEETADIGIPGVVAAKPVRPPLDAIRAWVTPLEQGVARGERAAIYNVLRDAVPEFRGEAA